MLLKDTNFIYFAIHIMQLPQLKLINTKQQFEGGDEA